MNNVQASNLDVPSGEIDVLSDVMSALEVGGSVRCRCELSAPWGIRFDPGEAAVFHLVDRGGAWLSVDGEDGPVPLSGGDLVVCRRGLGHRISDDPGTSPLYAIRPGREADENPVDLRFGGGGPKTTLVCGGFRFRDGADHPMLKMLPPLIHVEGEGGRAAEWLSITMRAILSEAASGRPGSWTIVRRLSDVLFIQVLRAWLERQPEGGGGWLGALRDRQIVAALGAMHRAPERGWSVASLASEAAMSRSAFSARFDLLVGEPPIRYLTRWRMQAAATTLRRTDLGLSEIAARVGYGSAAAFSKTFKRELGVSPGAYRRQTQAA